MTTMNQVVEYGKSRRGGTWGVRNAVSNKTTCYIKDKNEAIAYARNIVGKHKATLTIYGRDRQIQKVENYATTPFTVTKPKK